MARIPYTGAESIAQPGTISIPDDYMHVQASPDAFGAGIGQAGQFLGQSMEKVGGDLNQIAVQQKGFERQTAVTNALNSFQQSGMNQIWGDPNNPQDQGYLGTRGQQAATGWGGFAKGLDQTRQDTLAALGNDPVAREMFDRQSRRLAFSFGELAARHRQTQMQEAAVGANQAAVALSQQNGVLRYNDEDAFKNSLADAKRAQQAADQAAGVAPEVVDLHQRKVESDMVAARVNRMAADNPMVANSYLQQNLGSLLPAQQTALIDSLKAQVRQRGALDLANSHVGDLSNPTAPYVHTPTGPVPDMIRQSAQTQGIDPGDALATAKIESGVGTVPDRPGSQYQGVFQMGDDAWAARGGTAVNRKDKSAQVDLGVANLVHSRDVARDALNRDPLGWETYLVHQQGDGGGAALLKAAPDQSAVSVLLPAYKGDAEKARQAVIANGGTPGMNAGEFRNLWQSKFQSARGATGAQITAAGADQGAKAPMQPITTQADYYRDNFDRVTEETRADALGQHPDDPAFADLAVARVQQKMGQAIQAQQKSYQADSNILWQAANGDLAKGVSPGSVDELVKVSPQVQQAWQRVQVQQPQLAHAIATRVLSQNVQPDDGKDSKTYGDQFYQQFQRVHAADGDPNKLTNPDDLYGMLGHGLTMSGVEKLRGEIMSRRTPEGEAEASLRSQFFKTARSQISGADDGLGLRDPKGEAQFLRFQAKAYDEINTARAAGKTASQIYNPDSPDYVGRIILSYKRSLAQRTADMLDAAKDSQVAPVEQPGFFGRLFGGGPDLSTPDAIRQAVQTGKITREEAVRRLSTPALTPAATE